MPRRRDFAEDTEVRVEKSKMEIELLLRLNGADGFHTGWQGPTGDDPGWDAVEFLWKGRTIRFRLSRPQPTTVNAKGQKVVAPWAQGRYGLLKTGVQLQAAIEQRNRQRWRVLYLVIKAKIEAVQAGVAVFEEEFLSFIVTGDGQHTIGEILVPRLQGDGALLLPEGQP